MSAVETLRLVQRRDECCRDDGAHAWGRTQELRSGLASSPMNGACATALIDRLIHPADLIPLEGQSDRRTAAGESAAARKTKAKR